MMAGGAPGGGPGDGSDHGGNQSSGAAPRYRSRSPRGQQGAGRVGPAHSRGPHSLPSEHAVAGPPTAERPPCGPVPGLAGMGSTPCLGHLSPCGGTSAPCGSPVPAGPGAVPNTTATAAALASQLPLQQAAVAAAQAARAAAATVPVRSPGRFQLVPTGTSLAILEAQVAALGSLLLALQGIVLQLIAVVNLMRSGS